MHSLKPFKHTIQNDAWESLRAFTDARIALGSTGVSVPLKETLRFKMAHAHARDAVHTSMESNAIAAALGKFGWPVQIIKSRAGSRTEYLQRPDRGRQLSEEAIQQLKAAGTTPCDIAIIIADGLSATAIHLHVIHLLDVLVPLLKSKGFSLAAFTIVEQARVAIGDPVASLLQAKLSVIIIGERPGLSSFDSMGAYITYRPVPGLTDERRNCVSNIRPAGLGFEMAAGQISYLVSQCFLLQISGVKLKDERLLH